MIRLPKVGPDTTYYIDADPRFGDLTVSARYSKDGEVCGASVRVRMSLYSGGPEQHAIDAMLDDLARTVGRRAVLGT